MNPSRGGEGSGRGRADVRAIRCSFTLILQTLEMSSSTSSSSGSLARIPSSSLPTRRRPLRSLLPLRTSSAARKRQSLNGIRREKMCVTSTKSTGYAAAASLIAAADSNGPAHLRSDSAFSVHSMGTRSLATNRRAAQAIKVSLAVVGRERDCDSSYLSRLLFSTSIATFCALTFFLGPRNSFPFLRNLETGRHPRRRGPGAPRGRAPARDLFPGPQGCHLCR